MNYQVNIHPSGEQFFCKKNENLLSAALKSGVVLPYGCKSGICGNCKGKILSGKVKLGHYQENALSEKELQSGFTLFCCAHAESNLIIESEKIQNLDNTQVKRLPSKIINIKRIINDVIILTLRLPANQTFEYKAGQYIDFLLKNGSKRSYSIANAPNSSNDLSFHIKHMPGGVFTDQLFSTIKEKDILRIEGPLGSFFLREDFEKPIIFVASGTGFAPIKSIMEYLILTKTNRKIVFYWGAKKPEELYLDSKCKEWTNLEIDFKYVPVIFEPDYKNNWKGRFGYVHDAVVDDYKDLSNFHIYTCGSSAMVNSAKHKFVDSCNLPEDNFFSDSFISEADLNLLQK